MSNPTKQWFQLTSSLAVVLAVIILLVLASDLMRVRLVTCQLANNSNCPADVESELQSLQNSRLLFSNLTQKVQALTSVSQRFKVRTIAKNFLGEVSLVLQPINPIYLATINSDQYLVTELGGLIPQTNVSTQGMDNYCNIIFSQNSDINPDSFNQATMLSTKEISSELHDQLKLLLEALEVRQLQCRELRLMNQHAWVLSLPSVDRVVIDPIELEANLDRLVLLAGTSILSEKLQADSYLDVRFSLPVLRKSL